MCHSTPKQRTQDISCAAGCSLSVAREMSGAHVPAAATRREDSGEACHRRRPRHQMRVAAALSMRASARAKASRRPAASAVRTDVRIGAHNAAVTAGGRDAGLHSRDAMRVQQGRARHRLHQRVEHGMEADVRRAPLRRRAGLRRNRTRERRGGRCPRLGSVHPRRLRGPCTTSTHDERGL
jgi:hypothetical protein